jgi:serine/threonine protein kinase
MYVKVYLQADGVTYAARDQHEYFAVKKMVKRKMHFYNSAVAPSSEDPLMELSIQQFLGMAIAGGHPFVCRLHECCEDAENIYAIMEALQGGDCFEFCINSSSKTSTGASAAAIPEDIARVLYTQIVLGLKHMFDCKVSHCDLTLENVMLTRDKKRAVIIDFGMAKYILPRTQSPYGHHRAPPLKRGAGKPLYVPPECYPDQTGVSHRFDAFYGDLWSIGVLLFIMLTGSPPVDRAYPTCERYMMVCRGEILKMLDSWDGQVPNLSECARDLITRLLIPDPPGMRLRLDEILEHPWVTGFPSLLLPFKNFMRSVQCVRWWESEANKKVAHIAHLRRRKPIDTEELGRLNGELEGLKQKMLEERGQQPELRRQYVEAKETAKAAAATGAPAQDGPGMRK